MTIGGIVTCLRGVLDHAPADVTLGIVGVADADPDTPLGRWQVVRRGDRDVWFLPVARVDSQRPRRFVPSRPGSSPACCATGRGSPAPRPCRRTGWTSGSPPRLLFRGPLVYCIHTQERGLLGPTSDSFWRFLGGLHERLDRAIARRADRVIVFNPAYAEKVRQWNPRTVSAPTWFDPAITVAAPDPAPPAVVWVGRLEVPKDPELAVRAFAALAAASRTCRGRSRSSAPAPCVPRWRI